jgi:uncharacterized membrane protein
MEFGFKPDWTWLAVAAGVAAALVLWSYLAAKGRAKPPIRWLLYTLRVLALAAVTLCLLDPQKVERIEHQKPARLAVLLDTSRSMALRDVTPNRLGAAKAWLNESLAPNLPPGAVISWLTFDQNLSALVGTSRMPPAAFDAASPTGGVTALGDALDNLLTLQTSDPSLGVVLCSDGIETARADAAEIARLYRRKGIPIHTATFGTTNEPRDIAVENIQVKQSVASQARSRVLVTLRSEGFPNEIVPVMIRAGGQVVAQKNVRLAGGEQNVELEFTPRTKGYHVYEALIPPREGEWLATNNRRPFGLEVADPSIHVLYMEGTPTHASMPEWKYLKDALESDTNIHCKVLFRFPGSANVGVNTVDADPITGDAVYHVQHPTHGFPHTMSELLEYDIVINSDIPKESFSAEQLQNTARLVEEFGGGFVMIGGKKAFGAGGYQRTIMNKFIPVAMENDADTVNKTFQLTILPQAINHPLIAFSGASEETLQIWNEKFPPLRGYNRVGRAKPGAIVLGVDLSEENQYGPRVILAAQEVGKGRTMAFTSDTTRSWGTQFETIWGEKLNPSGALTESNCDARYYRQFWVNAIHWLAAGKAGKTNNAVTMELAQTVCRIGDPVTALIRVLGPNQQETGEAEVFVNWGVPNGTNRVFKARYEPATRLYRAVINSTQAGDFTLSATAQLKGLKLGEDKKLLICEPTDPELQRVRVNAELMAEIARNSGGESLSLTHGNSAVFQRLFAQAPPVTIEIRRTPLWDRTQWLALLFALLAIEWILRRRNGLA